MTEGTKSWLFGFHSLIHTFFVYYAWVKLYRTLPSFMETVCILIHDFGYCGMNYITNRDHNGHEILGAELAGKLFGQEAYDLCVGHRKFGEKLEIPDEYSHVLMPMFLLRIERIMENSTNLMGPVEWQRYTKDRWEKRLKGQVFRGQFNDIWR